MENYFWFIFDGRCGQLDEVLPPHPYALADELTCAIINWAGIAGAILAIITMYFGMRMASRMALGDRVLPWRRRWMTILTMIWAIAPPTWFWFEYWGLYMTTDMSGAAAFEQFRYNQQISAAIWAGVLAFAVVILNRAYQSSGVQYSKVDKAPATELDPNQYVVTIFKQGSTEPRDGRAVWTGTSRADAMTNFFKFAEEIEEHEDIKLTQEKVLRFHKISVKPKVEVSDSGRP